MKSNKKLILIVVLILLSLLIYLGKDFFQIFIISSFVAFFIHPIKVNLNKKFNNQLISSILSEIISIIILISFLIIITIFLIKGYNKFYNLIFNLNKSTLLTNVSNFINSFDITQSLTNNGLNKFNEFLQSLIILIPGLLLKIIVFIFILFYLIRYDEDIIIFIKSLVPENEKKDFNQLLDRLSLMLNGIFKGQLISAILQSLSMFIFYSIIKFPFSFEVSFIAFIIIVLGFYSSIVPIILIIYYLYQSFKLGNYNIFILNIIFTLFVTSIDNVIKPIIGKTSGKMNMLLFVIGTMGGVLTLGYTGFLLGPLIVGLFQIVFEIYFKEKKLKL